MDHEIIQAALCQLAGAAIDTGVEVMALSLEGLTAIDEPDGPEHYALTLICVADSRKEALAKLAVYIVSEINSADEVDDE